MKYLQLLYLVPFFCIGQELNFVMDKLPQNKVFVSNTLPVIRSDPFNKYIAENYGKDTLYRCGNYYRQFALSPDQLLENDIKSGKVKIISTFTIGPYIESYTPIRDLLVNTQRPAVFKGFYLVSE